MLLQSNVSVKSVMEFSVVQIGAGDAPAQSLMLGTLDDTTFQSSLSSEEEVPEPEDVEATLDEAAQDEREYVRRRVRDDLGREPSEEEVDEWLRRHTEGY